jgi:hypothetical protein
VCYLLIFACLACCVLCAVAEGAKLADVRTVDDEHIMIHWLDGEVEYIDNGKGPGAFRGHPGGGEIIHRYSPGLDTAAASSPENYSLTSPDEPGFAQPLRPIAAFRRTKVNGTDNTWPEANYTLEHIIYLRLPRKLQQGRHYTLTIEPSTNSDTASRDFSFDIYSSLSEAIHVNIVGYHPDHTKAADLYMWLGDGGSRDYAPYIGRKVMLYNVQTQATTDVGTVTFWKKSGSDCGGWDFTKADVWNCDFSSFTGTGTYRLVIDGVGCSPDFQIRRDVYYEPYKTSVRGFYYMRIGEDKDVSPVPRQPRYIPDKDPAGFKVYLTTLNPWHPDWRKSGGWDARDWSNYRESGNPTNPNAYGGHSDAADWDRHLGHISIIWDMLLPYFLSNGKLSDDNLQIRESGNGIPDIIDEARNEVDLWLRLRDTRGGYSTGLNNPDDKNNVMYQAAASPYMAWGNAANAAMLADCFRIAGNVQLMNHYRDAAQEAWKVANEEGLDLHFGMGNCNMRGRDLKMLAAAHLYILTGDRKYEDVIAAESAASGPHAELRSGHSNQYWATAAYLMCARMNWQPIHYPDLLANMKASITAEAREKNMIPSTQRPSRRSCDHASGHFQSTQDVHALIIAHAMTADPVEREAFLRAMLLEADWGLGRNPMNLVQMTGLGSRRAENIYTTGRNDGVPGVHPGHTPYMNAKTWWTGPGAYMSDPQWLATKGYPDWSHWPQGEALWNAPYCYANSEFTPQQTMAGKMALLGYLYSLGETPQP